MDGDRGSDRLQDVLDLAAVQQLFGVIDSWARMTPDTSRRQAYDRISQVHEQLIRRVAGG